RSSVHLSLRGTARNRRSGGVRSTPPCPIVATMRLRGLLLVLGGWLPAQSPAVADEPDPIPKAAEELIAAVRAAHWKRSDDRPLDRYHAHLRLPSHGQDHLQLDLEAWFAAPGRASGEDVRLRATLLRYRIERPEETLERGFDGTPWGRTRRGVYDIEGRDHAQEREELQGHVRLARQLLDFFDPAAVLRRMTSVSAPTKDRLKVGRDAEIDTLRLRGRLATFPLYAPPEGVAPAPPVELTVWVAESDRRIAAVEVHPLDGDGRRLAYGERYVFGEPRDHQGVVLPLRIHVYRVHG